MVQDLSYNQRQLLNVRRAIADALESGTHSATVSSGGGSESFTRLSLAALREMEKDYERRVVAEGGGSTRTRPDFGRVS